METQIADIAFWCIYALVYCDIIITLCTIAWCHESKSHKARMKSLNDIKMQLDKLIEEAK